MNSQIPQGKGVFGTLQSFVTRDVRSFKWWGTPPAAPVAATAAMPAAELPAAALRTEADLRHVESLRVRRQVLDWRDEFDYQLTEMAAQASAALAAQIDLEFATMSFLQREVFPQRAHTVLARHIKACIRAPLRRTMQLQEDAVLHLLRQWLPHPLDTSSMWLRWPKLDWDAALSMRMTAGQRLTVVRAVEALTLGPHGLAARHRAWATQFASQILAKQHAQLNPV